MGNSQGPDDKREAHRALAELARQHMEAAKAAQKAAEAARRLREQMEGNG